MYKGSGSNYMNFGDAIKTMKAGYIVARQGWNGRGIYIGIHKPSECDEMTAPFIYIDTTGLITDNHKAPKCRVPWLASQTDMLAEDWVQLNSDSNSTLTSPTSPDC